MTARTTPGSRRRSAALPAFAAVLAGALALTGCTHHTVRNRSRHSKVLGHGYTSTHHYHSTTTTTTKNCSYAGMDFTVKARYTDSTSPGKALITARNKTSRTCRLPYPPLVSAYRPGKSHLPLPHNEDSKPGFLSSTLKVAPGHSVYASFPVASLSDRTSTRWTHLSISPGAANSALSYTAYHDMRLRTPFRVAGTPKVTYWQSSSVRARQY